MSTEQNNAVPVAFGCHCDLEPGMEPDGCVLDKGMPEDCTHARRISSKEQCVLWKPITPPAAAPAPAVPQGTNWHAHHVIVGKAALQMVRNALRNDMERGLIVRGEMLEELDKVTYSATPAAPSQEPGKCAQCKKPYRKGENTKGCPKCAPGVVVPESEFQKPISVQEPDMHIGACITDGVLHATVMRREANGHVTTLATAEMDAASLVGHDVIAKMSPAAPSQPVACGLCQGPGVLSPTQKCICQYGGKEPVTLTDEQWLEYLLRNAPKDVLSMFAVVGRSIQTQGRWIPLAQGFKALRFIENAIIAALREKEQTK